MDHTGPSWVAAIEAVVEAWIRAGRFDGAEEALDRMRSRLAIDQQPRLALAAEALLRAPLLLAPGQEEPAAAEAERALAETAECAPWWRTKAIRALEQVGTASAALLDEATTIEARLGIV